MRTRSQRLDEGRIATLARVTSLRPTSSRYPDTGFQVTTCYSEILSVESEFDGNNVRRHSSAVLILAANSPGS
jgi:hypothetical protein